MNVDATPAKVLSKEEVETLQKQNSRLVPHHKAQLLETQAKKHWDLFYKRNENRFFKDRRWTTREFEELLNYNNVGSRKVLLEVGCGVGNFIYPLIEDELDFFIYACDLSSKAIDIVKQNELYDESRLHAFQIDVTTEEISGIIGNNRVDVATLIFVLSAIHPDKFSTCLKNVYMVLKPGGILLFRDYGLYDMAQLRFKPGHKISENFYMRQDGTRSYYFSIEELEKLATDVGFQVIVNEYIHRRTVNKKEEIDVPRIFVQAKFQKLG